MPSLLGSALAPGLVQQVLDFVAGLDRPAWLVGGFVRDQLLGRASHDLDLIVPEGGIALARAIAGKFHGGFFVLDSDRDVGRAVLRGEAGELLDVDIARLRVPDLLGDLSLRDYTVNAIAVDVRAGVSGPRVFDPLDGRRDLSGGILRAVAPTTFVDDPLRMLRGLRQAVELGFRLDDATIALIRRDAPLIERVAAERVRDELRRILTAPGAAQHLRRLADLGLLSFVLPDSAAQIGVTQSYPHYQDVFDHTRSALAHLEGIFALLGESDAEETDASFAEGYRRPALIVGDSTIPAPAEEWDDLATMLAPYRGELHHHLARCLASEHSVRGALAWATMMHDWGKPSTRSVDPDGRIRFFGHEEAGAQLAERRGLALRFSAGEVAHLKLLVANHMRPSHLAHDFPPGRRAIYRFHRGLPLVGPDCALLGLADHMATWAPAPPRERWLERLETSRLLLHAFFVEQANQVNPVPLLNGNEIMAEFGLAPGPRLGELIEALREAQAAGEVADVTAARAWLSQHLAA